MNNSTNAYFFFPFSPMDYSSILHYLEEKQQSGWLLVKLYPALTLAKFVPIEKGTIHYAIDITALDGPCAAENTPRKEQYYQKKKEQGWQYIDSLYSCRIFYTDDNYNAPPLNTSDINQQKQLNRLSIRDSLFAALLALIIPILGIYWICDEPIAALQRMIHSPLLLSLLLLIQGVVIINCAYELYRCRENDSLIRQNQSLLVSNHPYLSLIPTLYSRLSVLLVTIPMFLANPNGFAIVPFLFFFLMFLLMIKLLNYRLKWNGKDHASNLLTSLFQIFLLVILFLIFFA